MNLLNIALGVQPKQTVQWFAYASGTSTQTPDGMEVSGFAAAVNVVGSFQPVPRESYQTLGLDFDREYVQFFASTNIQPLQRDIAGDEFVFAGERFHVMSDTDWFAVNGWKSNMAVKISNT